MGFSVYAQGLTRDDICDLGSELLLADTDVFVGVVLLECLDDALLGNLNDVAILINSVDLRADELDELLGSQLPILILIVLVKLDDGILVGQIRLDLVLLPLLSLLLVDLHNLQTPLSSHRV